MKNTALRKRILAGLAAAAMLLATAACQPGQKPGTSSTSGQETPEGKVFPAGTEISIAVGSHSNYPYQENWEMWKLFQEAVGATFHIQLIPDESYGTRVPLMMAAPDQFPDLLHCLGKEFVDSHCVDGAFVSISDNLEKMPHFTQFFDSLPEEKAEELMMQKRSGDGKVYIAPVYGTETVMNLRTWMYRKDIFEKHGLEPPETLDELYNVCLELKELYPESYPLCFRQGLMQLDTIGPSFAKDFSYQSYYDFAEEKWKYGAAEDTTLDIIAFFHKMFDASLVPPDYLTILTKSWEELVMTDRAFIMPEYVARIDYFNIPGRKENPEYTWAIMEPPKANTPNGRQKIMKLNMDPTGYMILNTGKQDRIDNAFKLVDWMYSDEGSELLSWGAEDVTYQLVNGEKQFIGLGDESPQQKYGVGTYGLYQRCEPAAWEAGYTKEQNEQGRIAAGYTEDRVNPVLWVSFDPNELQVSNELNNAIKTYTDEALSKFLLKQRPMSEWDAFQKELKDMGVDQLLEYYSKAYKKATGQS